MGEELMAAPSAMLTDLYQLTMAQAYYASGLGETEGCFHLFFRKNPFGGGFSVACGIEQARAWLESWRFNTNDVDYLSRQVGNDGRALFTQEFLDTLRGQAYSVRRCLHGRETDCFAVGRVRMESPASNLRSETAEVELESTVARASRLEMDKDADLYAQAELDRRRERFEQMIAKAKGD